MSRGLASVRKNLGGFCLQFRDSPRDQVQFYPGIQRLFCPIRKLITIFPPISKEKRISGLQTQMQTDFWNMTIHPRPTEGPTAYGYPACSAPPLLLGSPGF